MGQCCSSDTTKKQSEIELNTNAKFEVQEATRSFKKMRFRDQVELYQMKCLSIISQSEQNAKTNAFTPPAHYDFSPSSMLSLTAEPLHSYNSKTDHPQPQLSYFNHSKSSAIHSQGIILVRDNENSPHFWGAGVLIGPNLVLTAAKSIFNEETSAVYNEITFTPGVYDMHAPFGTIGVLHVYYPDSYKTDKTEDFALLVLSEAVGILTGYCGLDITDPDTLKKKELHLLGYPIKRLQKTLGEGSFEASNTKISVQKHDHELLQYKGPLPGVVGTAIYYREGIVFFLIGIGCSEKHGIRLTMARFKQIKTWIQDAINRIYLGIAGKDWDTVIKIDRTSKNLQDYGASIISDCPLSRLKNLVLKNNSIGDIGAACLGSNTRWTNLTYLDLEKNQIGKAGISGLINAPWTTLNTLRLGGNRFGDEGATELAKNTTWKNLEILNLYQNDIGEQGANGLAANISWSNLKVLDLTGNSLQDKGAANLAKNIFWKQLQTLILERNGIHGIGLHDFCQSQSWNNLEVLILNFNKIEAQGLKALAETDWSKLQRLELNNNSITSDGAEFLARNPSWVDLRILSLDENSIGDTGMRALSNNPKWTHLTELHVRHNWISDEGIHFLVRSSTWENLIALHLSNNQITDKGLQEILKNTCWPNLETLSLHGNPIKSKEQSVIHKHQLGRQSLVVQR